MKKIIIPIILTILLVPIALAEETKPLAPNSINPNNGIFYKIDLWFEENAIKNAGTPEAKAKLMLAAINERNEEMKTMAQKGLTTKVAVAKMNQEKHMAQIQNEIQKMTKEKAKEIENGLIRSRDRLRYLSEQKPEVQGLKSALQSHEENIVRVQEKVSQKGQ